MRRMHFYCLGAFIYWYHRAGFRHFEARFIHWTKWMVCMYSWLGHLKPCSIHSSLKSADSLDAIKVIPPDRIMIETGDDVAWWSLCWLFFI